MLTGAAMNTAGSIWVVREGLVMDVRPRRAFKDGGRGGFDPRSHERPGEPCFERPSAQLGVIFLKTRSLSRLENVLCTSRPAARDGGCEIFECVSQDLCRACSQLLNGLVACSLTDIVSGLTRARPHARAHTRSGAVAYRGQTLPLQLWRARPQSASRSSSRHAARLLLSSSIAYIW